MGVKSILFDVSEVNGIKYAENGLTENGLIVSAARVFQYAAHWLVIDSEGNEWICADVKNYKQFTREEVC